MKKLKKIISLALTTAIAVTSFASCNSNSSSSGSSDDVIKIVVAGPMTGDNAEYGIGFHNAVSLKVDEWNDNGGVLGKQIVVVQYDDKNSSEEAATIAQKIVGDSSVVGVIGHFSSGVCLTAAPIYQDNKIIEISPSASHPDYSLVGDFIFRNNAVISNESAAILNMAINDLDKKNIGIISIKTDWGTNTSKIVTDLAMEMGDDKVKIVAHEEVVEGSDDYSSVITKINQAGADVVICVGMYNLVAPVAKQYKQINPDIEILGFSNSYSQQLIELGGEAVEGIGFPVSFFSESEEEYIKSYVETYETKFGSKPSALTSQAYDSAGLLLTAIENAGSTDADAIRDALASLTYDGVTGKTKFDEQGDVNKEFVKVTIKDGKFTKLD